MRILAVCAVDRPGGAEIGLERLLRRRPAWTVTLATPGDGLLRATARAAGWDTAALPVGGLERGAGARALAAWPAARRLARAHDVTYLNGTVAARLLPAVASAGPTVLHVHDMVARVPRFWSRANVVLADSAAVARRLPDLRSDVVGCPVELDPPVRDRPPWPVEAGPRRPVVAFVGRLEPRKGPDLLVAAAPEIRARCGDVRVVLVGDDAYGGDPHYARAVQCAAEVEHVGWVADAPSVLRHVDVLVAPSRSEPFGTVLAEAMAVGTPVVATAVDGLFDTVADGVTGRLVAPDDPAALAAGVAEVLGRHDEMGTAARAWARRFDADAYARRVGGLVEGAAAR